MKPHTLHRLYKAIMFVVLAGIVMVVYRTNPDFLKAPKAESSTAQNVSGFAWSGGAGVGTDSGIGWISFNDTSDASAPPTYGVNVDTATGDFSGTAWSENIGWISFDRSKTNNPPLPPYDSGVGAIAKVDTGTGIVTGWARAISGCEATAGVPATICTSFDAGAATGGWDGWIKLSAETTDPVQYGISISGAGQFSGYAWGDDILGWIIFSGTANDGSPYGVQANFQTCTLANVDPATWGSCTEQAGFCDLPENPPGTPIPGTRIGTCGFGYSGNATQTCDPGTYCAPPAAVIGNGICEPGETMLNAPTDCKGKVEQF